MLVSVLIPAYNEASNLPRTIRSFAEHLRIPHEIIVADHNSDDDTADVAIRSGANILELRGGSVAHVRNQLVEQSKGDILIFNDADVEVGSDWGGAIEHALQNLNGVTGAILHPPLKSNWVVDNWFRNTPTRTYVGTGHMIISKNDFEQLGGFNSALTSGEDVDLCERAISAEMRVALDPALLAIHSDFPTTLKSFFRREVWHGAGDLHSFRTAIKSKVVLAATLFVALLLASIIKPVVLILAMSIPITCSLAKRPELSISSRLPNIVLWTVYLVARAWSIFHRGDKRPYAEK